MKAQIKIVLAALVFVSNLAIGQNECKIQVIISKDTLVISDMLEVTIKVESVKGSLKPPEFKDFIVVMGPNISSSLSVINGVVDQQKSHSYLLRPQRAGQLEIEPASFDGGDVSCLSEPRHIRVVPLDGFTIDQDSDRKDSVETKLMQRKKITQDSISEIQKKLKALKKKKI